MFNTSALGQILRNEETPVHLTQATVKTINLAKPHEMAVTLDGSEAVVPLPALCLAPPTAQVWVLGKGSKALILGPAQWISYTPVLSQGASTDIAKTLQYSRFLVEGYKCTYIFALKPDAAGTAGSSIKVTLPITCIGTDGLNLGPGEIYDASAVNRYAGVWERTDSGVRVLLITSEGESDGWGATPNLAAGSTDDIRANLQYQIA